MTHTTLAPWMQRLGLRHPIIQAPMTGTATPQLAAAVSNAGALGSIGLGAYSLEKSKTDIEHTQSLTSGPFNVNLFYHQHPQADAQREQAWLEYLAPEFARFGATAPARLQAVYPSALGNTALQQLILAQRPAVVSFHFGLPEPDFLAALKAYGCITLACATDLDEALAIEQAALQPHDEAARAAVQALCQRYTQAMGRFGRQAGEIDTLVLGCTHYVFAQEHLRALVGPDVQLLDTGVPVARHTRRLLLYAQLLAAPGTPAQAQAPCVQWLTSGNPLVLRSAVAHWLHLPTAACQRIMLPPPALDAP